MHPKTEYSTPTWKWAWAGSLLPSLGLYGEGEFGDYGGLYIIDFIQGFGVYFRAFCQISPKRPFSAPWPSYPVLLWRPEVPFLLTESKAKKVVRKAHAFPPISCLVFGMMCSGFKPDHYPGSDTGRVSGAGSGWVGKAPERPRDQSPVHNGGKAWGRW